MLWLCTRGTGGLEQPPGIRFGVRDKWMGALVLDSRRHGYSAPSYRTIIRTRPRTSDHLRTLTHTCVLELLQVAHKVQSYFPSLVYCECAQPVTQTLHILFVLISSNGYGLVIIIINIIIITFICWSYQDKLKLGFRYEIQI